MFPNLEAEQARNSHGNSYIAEKLGISRQAYEIKKKTGNFKLTEAIYLSEFYKTSMDYLFSKNPIPAFAAVAR